MTKGLYNELIKAKDEVERLRAERDALQRKVEKLRKRTHEIQERADKRQADLNRQLTEARMEVAVMNGVIDIGGHVFWDICKCADRPLHLSIADRATIGARLLLEKIKRPQDAVPRGEKEGRE